MLVTLNHMQKKKPFLKKKEMVFKNGVKYIQAAGYNANGAHMVY